MHGEEPREEAAPIAIEHQTWVRQHGTRAREANSIESEKERERSTDSNVMGTIPSPLFSHGEHDGRGCSKFGSFTPLYGSALHDGVENSLCAGCHAMISQTVGKCANEIVDRELRAMI